MKKQSLFVLIFALAIVGINFTSCKKEDNTVKKPLLTATFSTAGDNRPAPTSVVFTNNSSNAVSYLWDFGNGDTSTLKNPTYKYKSKGIYTVKLTVKNSEGEIKTSIDNVNIYGNLSKYKISAVFFYKESVDKTDGTPWDNDNTGPDLYFKVFNNSGTEVFNLGASYLKDVVFNQANNFAVIFTSPKFSNFPFTLSGLSTTYTLKYYDYDGAKSDEFINQVSFKATDFIPTDTLLPYPSTYQTSNPRIAFNFEWAE